MTVLETTRRKTSLLTTPEIRQRRHQRRLALVSRQELYFTVGNEVGATAAAEFVFFFFFFFQSGQQEGPCQVHIYKVDPGTSMLSRLLGLGRSGV